MPLYVKAYRQISELEDAERDPDGRPSDPTAWYAHPATVEFTENGWPGFTQGVTPGGAYGFTESWGFKVGTYGHFNQWRRVLTTMVAGCPEAWKDRPQPFAELFGFSDSDGIISGPVAKRIAADFVDFQPQAEAFAKTNIDGKYWLDYYNKWRRVFQIAADGGVVEFE